MRAAAIFAALLVLTACAVLDGQRAQAQDMGFVLTDPDSEPRPQVASRLRADVRPDDPARVLVIGDSLAQGFGTFLEIRAEARGLNMDVTGRGRPSTGLARGDFYDWPAEFRVMALSQRPDVVVAHFGANDMQSVNAPEGRTALGTPEWEGAYRDQIRKIYQIASDYGIVVYWLGPAPDGNTNLGQHLEMLNPVFEDEAKDHGARFIALTPVTSPSGTFERNPEIDGVQISMRTADGSHFTGRGYGLVADHVLDRIVRDFPETGPVVGTPTVAASNYDPLFGALQ